MKNAALTLGTLIFVCLLAAGCIKKETPVEQFWGTSFNLSKYNQIADLEAPRDNEPITSREAAVGNRVMENYIKSFEKQQPKTTIYTIDMGVGN